MDTDTALANKLHERNELRLDELRDRDTWRILNARHLSRELRTAERSNPLVREVMKALKGTGGSITLVFDSEDGGGRAWGVNSLELTKNGFKVVVDRMSIHSLFKAALATIGDILTDGPLRGAPSFPPPLGADYKYLSPISARLRYFDITFDQVMDRVREHAQTLLDKKQSS